MMHGQGKLGARSMFVQAWRPTCRAPWSLLRSSSRLTCRDTYHLLAWQSWRVRRTACVTCCTWVLTQGTKLLESMSRYCRGRCGNMASHGRAILPTLPSRLARPSWAATSMMQELWFCLSRPFSQIPNFVLLQVHPINSWWAILYDWLLPGSHSSSRSISTLNQFEMWYLKF